MSKNNKWLKKSWLKLILEVFVVFLGVTAGFLLNNWRSKEIDKNLEKKYISAFDADVNYNINELEQAVRDDSIWFLQATPLLHLLRDNIITTDSARKAVELISTIKITTLHEGTYKEIIHTGNLKIVSSFSLKEKIVDYYLSVEDVEAFNDYFFSFYDDFVMPFVVSEVNIINLTFRNKKIIKSFKFSNTFALYFSLVQQRNKYYKDLLKSSYSLKKEIEKYKVN